jgi:hypothetical protein
MMKRFVVAIAVCLTPALAHAQKPGQFQVYNNGAFADLHVDGNRVKASLDTVTRTFSTTSCEVVEGSIGAAGTRRLLRFDVAVVNHASADLVVGSPTNPNNPYYPYFHYSPCHGHYHLDGFTDYQLLNLDRSSVAAFGHKQAFCLEDLIRYGTAPSHGYTCGSQGITGGWADLYSKFLSGQWVDITGVPDGDYILHVEVNAAHTFPEGQNVYNNVYEVQIHLPLPGKGTSTTP